MASGPDKLKNIDLLFRNWNGELKNLMCSISPVTLSIKNYVVTEVTTNMSGYRTIDDSLQRVDEFYANRLFVVLSQGVEALSFPTSAATTGIRISQNIPLFNVTDLYLLFPKDARTTTCYENPCYLNIQVTTCGRNFPDKPMNTLYQCLFQMQLNASNLDLLFKATDEFEEALTTSRNTASRILNPHADLISFMITLQCERNCNFALTFDGLDIKNQNISQNQKENRFIKETMLVIVTLIQWISDHSTNSMYNTRYFLVIWTFQWRFMCQQYQQRIQ
ncbi:MAG: hypothetical protein EZS28_024810 [Streblomastix strix]|uniref:Uncharacterized protein n=1 Tax=Streblomastix strix TaxID=222440 RepID=A0A5J4VB74_9EUKA|nr:MAG: hypothetical protein EZS28_024810 [Streblomastix strix]